LYCNIAVVGISACFATVVVMTTTMNNEEGHLNILLVYYSY
jgi:hypothetical protein